MHRIVPYCLLILLLMSLIPERAFSHGGVVEEDDLCVIKVNYLRAHFKIYQPLATGHEQFCEDLPMATESIFVMEYQHDSLSDMLIDFRIIRDVTGKGRFARIEDVDAIEDLDDATVYYQPPALEPDVYTVNHTFTDEGDFVGIVSATHAVSGKSYAAVFPFEVGFTGLGYWPYILGLLLLVQIQYLVMSGRMQRWLKKDAAAAVIAMGFLFASSEALPADLIVSYSTPEGRPEINRMHRWILHIETDAGDPVEGAVVEVEGGMPEHDHGLPTRPRVTKELGGGDYQLDGVRFHMRGNWEIVVRISTEDGISVITIPLQL